MRMEETAANAVRPCDRLVADPLPAARASRSRSESSTPVRAWSAGPSFVRPRSRASYFMVVLPLAEGGPGRTPCAVVPTPLGHFAMRPGAAVRTGPVYFFLGVTVVGQASLLALGAVAEQARISSSNWRASSRAGRWCHR